MTAPPAILFSTFEPSGDALAAQAIEIMRRRQPDLKVYALGGPKMEAAGAEMLEHTTEHGTMFLAVLGHAWSHRKRLKRLRRWLTDHPIQGLVPVDSPAGNWSICRTVRHVRPDAKIVHLVAPQVWAWAPWRVGRLRRLTDHVLCLLPFEPQWLNPRGVRATFVGHPIFDPALETPRSPAEALPDDHPRLAVLPGSRRGEIRKNWPTMLRAFERLSRDDPKLTGAVAALEVRHADQVRAITARMRTDGSWPPRLVLVTGRTDAVLDWCDLALVASGTVTLQVAARLKPMVVMYNMTRFNAVIASLLIRTRTFTLPNLVSEWAGLGRVVPELIPHFGQVQPVVDRLRALLGDAAAIRRQENLLAEVTARFRDKRFSEEAPRQLLETIGLGQA